FHPLPTRRSSDLTGGASRLVSENFAYLGTFFSLESIFGTAKGPVGRQRHIATVNATLVIEIGTQFLHDLALTVSEDLHPSARPRNLPDKRFQDGRFRGECSIAVNPADFHAGRCLQLHLIVLISNFDDHPPRHLRRHGFQKGSDGRNSGVISRT